MKRKLPFIGIIIIFLIGIGVLSYPLISAVVNNIDARGKAVAYQEALEELPDPEIEEFLAGAEKYNKSLLNDVILTDPFDEEAYDKIGANYEETLDTDGEGLIGYIDIPSINVYLPIYHGTSLEVLEKGAGHLENSSMPIGGESTHAVISAHSAFPTQSFFDYLPELDEGDVFYVHVLNQTLKYEVDQIKVVLPDQTSDLNIIRGEDHLTLLTCTPYSVNTHRLLVRGVRVEMDESEVDTSPHVINVGEASVYFFGYELPYWVVAIILVVIVLVIVLIVLFLSKRRKKKNIKHLDSASTELNNSDEEVEHNE